jgi:hypothetical protein
VARAKSQPGRKVIDGVEYFSAQAAADVLGRSYRTLTRLEEAGVIRHPDPLPGQDPKTRWYSQQDLEELRRLVEQSGFGDRQAGGRGRLKSLLNDALSGPRTSARFRPWIGETISTRPRQFERRDPAKQGAPRFPALCRRANPRLRRS